MEKRGRKAGLLFDKIAEVKIVYLYWIEQESLQYYSPLMVFKLAPCASDGVFYFMAYVYRHIRLDKNEPFYIGIGSDCSYKRAYVTKRNNRIWNSIVSRCDYRVEIMIDDLTWDEACEKEKEFIAMYGRINLNTGILSNLTDGGDGSFGLKFTTESREKLSKSKMGYKHTEEWKKKMSAIRLGKPLYKMRGENHFMYGKKHSKETIEKMIAKKRGKKFSEESRIKMSMSHNGENCPHSRLIINTETGIYYFSCSEAARAMGVNKNTLYFYLNGRYKNKTNLIYA